MPPQIVETIALAQVETPAKSEILSKYPNDDSTEDDLSNAMPKTEGTHQQYKHEYNWIYIFVLGYFQLSGMYGVYLMFTSAKLYTIIFAILFLQFSLLGVSAGSHRYWSHKSFKAKLPLRILLAILHTTAYQENIFMWVRNHRLHHKYLDDDADPYNPKRGYFYAHMGWLMVKRHPRSIEKGRQLDMSDVLSDPVVQFQKKYYAQLVIFLCYLLPVVLPMYFWGESFFDAWHINSFRWMTGLHCALAVNSVAHFHGFKPYDKRIGPSNHWTINVFSVGEGAHNYHHVFPWDYRSIEMNTFYFNFTTFFIDLMAKIGWAYDLKFASDEMVTSRAMKTGIKEHRPMKIKG